MTDSILSYDPDTDEVIYPSGSRYPSDICGPCEAGTARALYEARREISNLKADKRFLSDQLVKFIPPPTRRVLLHNIIGEYMPSQPDLRVHGFAKVMNAKPEWWAEGTVSWPFDIADDGTVEVLA